MEPTFLLFHIATPVRVQCTKLPISMTDSVLSQDSNGFMVSLTSLGVWR